MPESPSYANRLRTKARGETARFIQHKLLTGACVATAVVIVRLALWHFHRLTLTWAEVRITLLTIVGSYGIVVTGAFVVNLFRATVLLDQERADEIAVVTDKLKQRTEEHAVLTAKLTTPDPLNKQKDIRITFAKLMEEGKNIEERIITNQKAHELTAITEQLNSWIKRTERAFIESDLETDAAFFLHSGERPSDEQMKAIPFYLQKQVWKHHDVARITAYLAKLQEIVERRNL